MSLKKFSLQKVHFRKRFANNYPLHFTSWSKVKHINYMLFQGRILPDICIFGASVDLYVSCLTFLKKSLQKKV